MVTRILQRYQWLVDHPVEFVWLLLIIIAVAYVIGAIVFHIWLRHEERKVDDVTRRYMDATLPREWRRPGAQ